MNLFLRFPVFLCLSMAGGFSAGAADVGGDLAAVFARARQGGALKIVVMGGSITSAAPEGWVGESLRRKFPKNLILISNAGMSGTGSALAVFRLERDVIAHQPDLVLLEFCVNDADLTDEDAIRYMESLVVRLKRQPHPPAILVLEAAAKDGVNLKRHREVAAHYGLWEVDLQAAVDAYLQKERLPWSTLFKDDVHPNEAGHEFYAATITAALRPFLASAGTDLDSEAPLPAPLSKQPLLLDGTLVNLAQVEGSAGWQRKNFLPEWWDQYFLGVLVAGHPGTILSMPVRGTTMGLFYPISPTYGRFLVSVDGGVPREIAANVRGGYGADILAKDLSAGEHQLTISLPAGPISGSEGPVNLGYLLVAGQTGADGRLASQGDFTPEVLSSLTFSGIPSDQWRWAGPFQPPQPKAKDARSAMEIVFPAETSTDFSSWQPLPGSENGWVDFRRQSDAPKVVYASAEIDADAEEKVLLGLAMDYYAKLWLNGELIATWNGPHGNVRSHQLVAASLRPGKNWLTLKLGSGSAGFGFSLVIGRSPLLSPSGGNHR